MPQQPTGSLLYPIEELTRYLTRNTVRQMAATPEKTRREVLEKFTRQTVVRDLVVLLDDWSRPGAASLVEEIRAEVLRNFDSVNVITASTLRESVKRMRTGFAGVSISPLSWRRRIEA